MFDDTIFENFEDEILSQELYKPKPPTGKTLKDITTWKTPKPRKIPALKPKPCKVLNYCQDCGKQVRPSAVRCTKCYARYQKQQDKIRYQNDPEYREKVLAYNRSQYEKNYVPSEKSMKEYNEARRQKLINQYRENPFKVCSRCGENKHLESFLKADTLSGRNSICKACVNSEGKIKRKPKVAARRAYKERLESTGILDLVRKEKRKENKQRSRQKLRKDPQARVHKAFSEHLRKALKGQCRTGWRSQAGWTKNELVEHLEAQFQEGMSWDNYGQWHVDHIKPRCLFSIESIHDPQFKECWGLHNLQPLWAEDNMRKGATYEL